jgi:hypothetical protein
MEICPHGAQGAPVLNAARAEASRRNGGKSRGPKTIEGKARSSRNAIKHGLRARRWVVLGGESEAEFKRLEAALIEEWAPEGVTQSLLVQLIAAAAWRLGRAEQIETQIITTNTMGTGSRSLGLAVIRDCNNPGALDTLIRYRGGAQAEFHRALRTLEALQAKAVAKVAAKAPAQAAHQEVAAHQAAVTPAVPEVLSPPAALAAVPGPAPTVRVPAPGPVGARGPNPCPALAPTLAARPDEPESPKNPGDSGRTADRANPHPSPAPAWRSSLLSMPGKPAPCAIPIEPECPGSPACSAPRPAAETAKSRIMSLLAGMALVPARQPQA